MNKLKYKLALVLFMTSVLPLAVMGVTTTLFLERLGQNEARERIESSLDVALSIYQRNIDNLKFLVRDSNRRAFVLMEEGQIDLLRNELTGYCRRNKLDFFVVTDEGGNTLISVSNPALEGEDLSTDKFVKRGLRFQTSASTEAMSAEELKSLGLDHRAQVGDEVSSGALVIKATTPIINRNEIIVGTMQAGYLINNNTWILHEIKKQTGLECSLFLGSQRVISTINENRKENLFRPAHGRLEDIKTRQVLSGRRYVGRTNVAGNMYFAAYTPIYDSNSEIIGILGVSLPEKDVFALRDKLIGVFGLAVLAAIILSLGFGIKNGSQIVEAMRRLRNGIEAFGRQDLLYRVRIDTGDELEELADFFNLTMEQMQKLEHKVAQSSDRLEKAEKKLVEFERMAAMGKMATALAHELRNIFAEIHGGIYNLKHKLEQTSPGLASSIDPINDSLTHASKVLSSVLSFSYPKRPILSSVDMNYLVEDLLASPGIREFFKRNSIKVEKTVSGEIPPIIADGLQLREMVFNLVMNAIQAMPEGGRLTVALENDQGMVRLRVGDTGPGIPEETMKNLFTPFFTTKSRGLGLGLCISKSVAEEHGGQIQVFSMPGKGATFVISLPIVFKRAQENTAV